jgi:rhamnose utilization protein RhaD (predicted bifunctional aldolase and dehydrogenase)
MSNAQSVLKELVAMSLEIGRPERDLVILGEGNTSAVNDDGTYWVKASGTQLGKIQPTDFVLMQLDAVCQLAEREHMSDDEFKGALEACRADLTMTKRGSTETVMHALALSEGGAKFVGHTHPVAVNALMCSIVAEEAIMGRLFPDEIVVCGPAPCYVPYTDPGHPLARAFGDGLRRYMDQWGMAPKAVLMQNHGLVALGASPTEVDSITQMMVKTLRILAGAYAFGGPHFLSASHADRIYTRPDEAYRKRELKLS